MALGDKVVTAVVIALVILATLWGANAVGLNK